MRTLPLALILAVAVAGAGCSKSSDSSTASSTATDASAASTAAASATTGSSGSSSSGDAQNDAKTGLPMYPGATSQASGSSAGQAGTVLTTDDGFDKVYGWYKDHMPSGSEKAKLDAGGMSTATFQEDASGGGKSTVAITSQGGKTTISLALTKM